MRKTILMVRYFFFCLLFINFTAKAQCPYVSGILADAIATGSPTPGEGPNEFVAFNTGGSAVVPNTVIVNYSTTLTSTNFAVNGTITPSVWTTLATPALITNSSGTITVATATTSIPANRNVVIIASNNAVSYDLKTFGTSVYVLPYNQAAGAPRVVAYAPLGNYGNSGGVARYVRLLVGASCKDTVSYIPSSLPGGDGGGAKWNSAGAITYYNTGGSGAVLPINLLSAKGFIQDGKSVINWTTTGNSSAVYFEIEKSNNGDFFKKAGTIIAHSEVSVGEKDYSFTDNETQSDIDLYRIRLIDADGTESYSPTIKLGNNLGNNRTKVYPNPVQNEVNIELKNDEITSLIITDFAGKILRTQQVFSGKNKIDVASLQPGIYLLQLKGATTEIQRFIKQ